MLCQRSWEGHNIQNRLMGLPLVFEDVYKGRLYLMKSWEVGGQGVELDKGGECGRFEAVFFVTCKNMKGVRSRVFPLISPGVWVRVNSQF